MHIKMLNDEAYTILGCGIFSHNTNSYLSPDNRGRYQLFGKVMTLSFWVELFGLGDIMKHRYTLCSDGSIHGLYGKEMDGSRAAIVAGYSPKAAKEQASRLLTKANIVDRISQLKKDTAKEFKLTKEFVINGILEIAKDGEQENNRIKAYDMLGKIAGVYEEDNSQQGSTQIVNYYAPQKDDKK